MCEMKNTLAAINNRVDVAEGKISEFEFEDKMKHSRQENKKIKQSVTVLWNNFRGPEITI